MIIDVHAHMSANPRDLDRMANSEIIQQVWIMNNFYDKDEGNPDGHITEKELLNVCDTYKNFFVPFGFLDFREPPSIVDDLKGKGFFGLKAIKPPKPYDSEEHFPYYEKAEKLKMPILFHTGIIGKETRARSGPGFSLGPKNMRPSMLVEITQEFPNLLIIGGHLGWPWIEETMQNLDYYPNIYHDICGGHTDYKWLIDNLDKRITDGVHEYLTDKLLFATDGRYGREGGHEGVFVKIKFWELFFKFVGKFHRWGEREEVEKIFCGNAKRISCMVDSSSKD